MMAYIAQNTCIADTTRLKLIYESEYPKLIDTQTGLKVISLSSSTFDFNAGTWTITLKDDAGQNVITNAVQQLRPCDYETDAFVGDPTTNVLFICACAIAAFMGFHVGVTI